MWRYTGVAGYFLMKQGLTIFFLTIAINGFSQLVDTTGIYFQSLKQYCIYLDKHGNKEKEIYIEDNIGITTDLPRQIGHRSLTVVTNENQKEIYKRNGNKIVQVRVIPAETRGQSIEVKIIPFSGDYRGKKNGFHLCVSDWAIIRFRYSCEEQRFIYYETGSEGI